MQRAPRAVLWAYVVVSVGCTSVASQAPEPVRYVSTDLAPATRVRTSRDVVETAIEVEADSLAVKIMGPTAVQQPSTVRFSATVTNGTAQRYYYWWFAAACARSEGCSPSSYLPVGEGEGKNELTLTFVAEHRERDIVVQVVELDGRERAGSSAEFVVAGPARRPGANVEALRTEQR
jgi:hypothetical protein